MPQKVRSDQGKQYGQATTGPTWTLGHPHLDSGTVKHDRGVDELGSRRRNERPAGSAQGTSRSGYALNKTAFWANTPWESPGQTDAQLYEGPWGAHIASAVAQGRASAGARPTESDELTSTCSVYTSRTVLCIQYLLFVPCRPVPLIPDVYPPYPVPTFAHLIMPCHAVVTSPCLPYVCSSPTHTDATADMAVASLASHVLFLVSCGSQTRRCPLSSGRPRCWTLFRQSEYSFVMDCGHGRELFHMVQVHTQLGAYTLRFGRPTDVFDLQPPSLPRSYFSSLAQQVNK